VASFVHLTLRRPKGDFFLLPEVFMVLTWIEGSIYLWHSSFCSLVREVCFNKWRMMKPCVPSTTMCEPVHIMLYTVFRIFITCFTYEVLLRTLLSFIICKMLHTLHNIV
jgi:hypothetical protein